jgi:hypothetical protein
MNFSFGFSLFMKNEKKLFYALTKREAHAAQDACNRVTADLPRNLGISDAQFDACDRAAYALAHPAIEQNKKVLVLTALEFDELFKCFMNGYDDGEYVAAYCQTAASKRAFAHMQKKLRDLWLEK